MLNDLQTVIVSAFVIATSTFLLLSMLVAAVHHDCRVPPKKVSVTGAVIMEVVCPTTLDKVW